MVTDKGHQRFDSSLSQTLLMIFHLYEEMNQQVNNHNNSSSNSLVFGRWPQTMTDPSQVQIASRFSWRRDANWVSPRSTTRGRSRRPRFPSTRRSSPATVATSSLRIRSHCYVRVIEFFQRNPEACFSVPRQNLNGTWAKQDLKRQFSFRQKNFFLVIKLSNLLGPTWPKCHFFLKHLFRIRST